MMSGESKNDKGDGISALIPLVSVIVPFYNVEAYITDCLDSLVSQDFDSYEIVCIDDGSTDRTGAILDEYAAWFDVVRVFHFQNAGLSVSRNRGVALARAELISFVDGDDFVSPEYLSTLYSAHCGVAGRLVQGRAIGCRNEQLRDMKWPVAHENLQQILYDGNQLKIDCSLGRVSSVAWAKLAHRSLYEEVPFSPGMVYEDIMAMPDIVEYIDELLVLDQVIYAHVIRRGSISRPLVMTEKEIEDYLAAQKHFIEVAGGWGEEVRSLIPWKMSTGYTVVVGMAAELPDRTVAEPYLAEATSYIRQHFLQLLKLRSQYSLGWKTVLKCGIAAISPRLYAFVRRAYLGVWRDALRRHGR